MVVANFRWLEGESMVRLDSNHLLPIHLAFKGARFRIRMNRQMVDQGAIPFKYFKYFFRREMPHDAVKFQDEQGRLLDTQLT